jgi:diguanylate cyclase (GGDEF)-like protein
MNDLVMVLTAAVPTATVAYTVGRLQARTTMRRLQRALRRARRAACTDALTGIANRGGLEQALAAAAAGRSSYAVVLLDLDNFKLVNDSYGHPVGDGVLIEVARRLAALVPADGLVARLGGDEFVVVAPSPAPGISLVLARDIERTIGRAMTVEHREIRVRASVGVVHAQPGADGSVLHAADRAAYEAKTAGGARVAEYDPTAELPALPAARPLVRLRDMVAAGRDLARGVRSA